MLWHHFCLYEEMFPSCNIRPRQHHLQRLHTTTIAACLAIVASLAAVRCHHDSPPGDHPAFPAIDAGELIHRFAPEIRLHPDEAYFPASVDWLLPRVALKYTRRGKKHLLVPAGQLTLQALVTTVFNGEPSGATHDRVSRFFLAITGDEARRGQEPQDDGSIAVPCYARVRLLPDTTAIDIQYWFFYPYHASSLPGLGAHEGDWEHITVRASRDGKKIQGVLFSRHGSEGGWETFQTTGDSAIGMQHPIVYAAKGSHASYPSPGVKRRGWLPDDHCDDGGPRWRCWEYVIDVGDKDAPRNGQIWLQFTGRWGTPKIFTGRSPETPSFKNSWKREPAMPGRMHSRERDR